MAMPSDFWEVHWVDLVIWVLGFGVCAFASLGSLPLRQKSGKKGQKQACSARDGPMTRLCKGAKAALVARGVTKRPLPRPQSERRKEPCEVFCPAEPGSRESLMIALGHALDQKGVDATFDLLKEMQCKEFPISGSTVERILRDHSPQEAYALLRRMQDAGVTFDVVMFNCFVAACVNASDMQCARAIAEDMRKVGTDPDVYTYGALLRGCLAGRDLYGAKDLLRDMAAGGNLAMPGQSLYNTLISAAVTGGNVQIAWDTIEMMKENEVPASGHTAQIVMELLRLRSNHRQLDSKAVGRVIEFLADSGINFSSHQLLLSTVIDTCVWHAKLPLLDRTLEQYWKSELKPAVRVYGLLIKAANALNKIDWVWKLWREMIVDRKMQPTGTVLGCMLDALVRAGQVDEACLCLQEWKSKVPPSTIMYATIIKGFLNTNQVAKSMQMLQEMRFEGVERNRTLYNMVIGVHAENGALDKLPELLKYMRTDGCPPDIITFSTMVKGHCVKGDLDSALKIFHEGQQSGLVFDAAIYNTIFFGCYRHDRHDLTDELVAEVISLGLTPSSFTLSTLVKMYGSQSRLLRAFEVVVAFRDVSMQHFVTDTRVVHSLLEVCTKNVNNDLPEHVFEALLAQGPDAKFFWPVVACRVLRGEYVKAQALVKPCRKHGPRPKEGSKDDLVEQLLAKLDKKKDQQRNALKLIEKLRIL